MSKSVEVYTALVRKTDMYGRISVFCIPFASEEARDHFSRCLSYFDAAPSYISLDSGYFNTAFSSVEELVNTDSSELYLEAADILYIKECFIREQRASVKQKIEAMHLTKAQNKRMIEFLSTMLAEDKEEYDEDNN